MTPLTGKLFQCATIVLTKILSQVIINMLLIIIYMCFPLLLNFYEKLITVTIVVFTGNDLENFNEITFHSPVFKVRIPSFLMCPHT